MKRKYFIISILILIISLISGLSVYAYFEKVHKSNHSISTNMINNVVEITNLDSFYKEIDLYQDTTHPGFNSDSKVSGVRKTLKLMNNLTLTADALVTSDCHIDLAGHELNLAGYKFNIKNTFDGLVAIFDSTNSSTAKVTDSKGANKLLIDIPNACFEMSNTLLDSNVQIDIINVSAEAVANSTLKFIYANLANEAMNDIYSTAETLDFKANVSRCTLNNDTHSKGQNVLGCIYTKDNLELLHNYYNYAVDITYTSSNPNVLTNLGIVKSFASTVCCPITVTVKFANTTVSADINVHIINSAHYAAASNMVLLQYLEKYYSTNDSAYIFENQIMLPKMNNYFNTSYNYIVKTASNSFDTTTTNDYFDKAAFTNYYLVKIDSDVQTLTIDTAGTQTQALPVKGKAIGTVNDLYSYCVGIVSSLYGNQITITEDTHGMNGFSTQKLLTDASVNGYSKLDYNVPIKYTLEGNVDNTYDITNIDQSYDRLNVSAVAQKTPYLGQNVVLKVSFTFKANESGEVPKFDVTVPIIYKPKGESNAGFNYFDPYYTYFNKAFFDETNNNTYNSFSIPLFYQNKLPTYNFLVYEKIEDDINQTISYSLLNEPNLFDISIQYPGGSLAKLDNFVMDPTLNLNDYMNNNYSKCVVTIDQYLIESTTKKFVFIYLPVYRADDNKLYYYVDVPATDIDGKPIKTHLQVDSIDKLRNNPDIQSLDIENYKYKSELTVPGIVRCKDSVLTKPGVIEAFDDPVFYAYMYNQVQSDIPYKDNKTTFIESDRLTTIIAKLDLSITNTKITTFFDSLKGIELFTGLSELDLHGRDITKMTKYSTAGSWVEQIDYITKSKSISILNLKNTGIYDMTSSSNLKFPDSATNNNLMAKLGTLVTLEKLDLSNEVEKPTDPATIQNQIYNFKGLEKLPVLKELIVTNNYFVVNYFSGFLSFLNGIFETIVNSLYGSKGGPNQAIYSILIARGATVINGGVIQISAEMKAIVDAISSLEIQDKLPTGMPMEKVYESFSTSPEKYKIQSLFYENLPNQTAKRLKYVFKSIVFKTNNTNSTLATGFDIIITYQAVYQDRGFLDLGDWRDRTEPDYKIPDIDFSYSYLVERI